LIGFGHIGREIAVRAQAFGMEIRVLSAHPPARKPQGIKSWSGSGGLRALLQDSDFVVLACPLNEATRGLIGVEELKRMKRDACLINIARGPIVDESALYHALKRRQIRAAAIDVWYRYPKERERQMPSKFPFHELQNVIMTPHASGWTNQTFGQRFRLIAENIDRLASGRTLLNVVQGPKRAGQLGSR
jgi:phosphoglycerate dehydrogenase-like enzyme